MDEKIYFIEIRWCEGSIHHVFGRDFIPNTPEYEWPTFRVLGANNNDCIDEIIAKLKSLKQ